MTFGAAIYQAEKGYRIYRTGWNGKNMFVALMPAYSGLRKQAARTPRRAAVSAPDA